MHTILEAAGAREVVQLAGSLAYALSDRAKSGEPDLEAWLSIGRSETVRPMRRGKSSDSLALQRLSAGRGLNSSLIGQ